MGRLLPLPRNQIRSIASIQYDTSFNSLTTGFGGKTDREFFVSQKYLKTKQNHQMEEKQMNLKIAFALATAAAIVPTAQAASQTADHEASAAVYSTSQSTIGALLNNPATRAVLEKHIPDLVANPSIQQASTMTLQAVKSYVPDTLSDEKLAAIDAELATIGRD